MSTALKHRKGTQAGHSTFTGLEAEFTYDQTLKTLRVHDGATVGGFPVTTTGMLIGFRNRIINGNFVINQRAVTGTVTLAAGAYGHDRWKAGAAGCTYTFATSGNDTIITISAGSLMQVVEDKNVEGGVYCLSNAGTAQARIAISGAATSGSYAAATQAAPLTTAAANSGQAVTVEFSTGTINKAQLEPGTTAFPFERRNIGLELLLCQRYLPAIPAGSELLTMVASTTLAIAEVVFQVPPRISPTGISTAALVNFAANNFSGAGPATPTAIAFSNSSTYGARVGITTTAGSPTQTGGNVGYLVVGSSGSILFTGCEL